MTRAHDPVVRRFVSKYTYERSLVRDVADTLASARGRVTSEPAINTIDMLISMLIDTFSEYDESFDPDDFADRARYKQ